MRAVSGYRTDRFNRRVVMVGGKDGFILPSVDGSRIDRCFFSKKKTNRRNDGLLHGSTVLVYFRGSERSTGTSQALFGGFLCFLEKYSKLVHWCSSSGGYLPMASRARF